MRRRDFITLLGGAAAAWPIAVRGQQTERVRRIAVLTGYLEQDGEARASLQSVLFHEGDGYIDKLQDLRRD